MAMRAAVEALGRATEPSEGVGDPPPIPLSSCRRMASVAKNAASAATTTGSRIDRRSAMSLGRRVRGGAGVLRLVALGARVEPVVPQRDIRERRPVGHVVLIDAVPEGQLVALEE